MGWSCTDLALRSLNALHEILKSEGAAPNSPTSNGWHDRHDREYFYETGRENADGSITGTVYRVEGGKAQAKRLAHKAGSFRIEPDGRVTWFPTASAINRREAAITAYCEAVKARGRANVNPFIDENHPAYSLRSELFLVV